MKKIACLAVFFGLCVLVIAVSAGEMRTWTASGGKFTTEAEFIETSPDGTMVGLRKKDGKEIQVVMERLSEEDQEYVMRQKPAKPQAAASTPQQSQGSVSSNYTAADTRKAGERLVLKHKGIEFAFRWCPPGTFTMGCRNSEIQKADYNDLSYYRNELQHKVQLTKGFWIAETETTQEQWEVFQENAHPKLPSHPSGFEGDKLPVESVRYLDCIAYIMNLCINEELKKIVPAGYQFSLPTEAQWEYACRAGTTTAFHFGDSLNGDLANCNSEKPYPKVAEKKEEEDMSLSPIERIRIRQASKKEVNGEPKPVGSYPPNAWGLYDMHGNVAEWCADAYEFKYDQVRNDAVDPSLIGAKKGGYMIIRGGSWKESAADCRSAAIDHGGLEGNGQEGAGNRIATQNTALGFRLVLIPK